MGKKGKSKPKGRAGQKQKAQNKQSPGQFAPRHQQYLLDDSEDDTPNFRGFSQANRPAQGQFAPRNPSAKLRHQTISFISASVDTPATQEEQEMDDEEMEVEDIDIVIGSDGQVLNDDDDDDDDDDDVALQTNIVTDTDIEFSEGAMAQMSIQSSTEAVGAIGTAGTTDVEMDDANKDIEPVDPSTLFFVDSVGDESLATKSLAPIPVLNTKRAVSPAPSASSDEEVVVFRGRHRPATTTITDPVHPPQKEPLPLQSTPLQTHVTDSLLAALDNLDQSGKSKSHSRPSSNTSRSVVGYETSEQWVPAPDVPYWRTSKGKARPDLDPTPSEKAEFKDLPIREPNVNFANETGDQAADDTKDEAPGDTIAQLRAEWKQTLQEKKAPKRPSRDVESDNRRGKRGRKKSNRKLKDVELSEEDEEDADEAATRDYMANLLAQLDAEDPDGAIKAVLESGGLVDASASTFTGPSMVVNGRSYADDEVLSDHPTTAQETSDAWEDASSEGDEDDEIIGLDIDELSSAEERLNASDLDSSELEEELEYTEREQWADEDDLRQRRLDRMTDEQVARLFAKQAELGIDGDELVIDDGAGYSDEDRSFGDVDAARAGLSDLTNTFLLPSSRRDRTGRRGARKTRGADSFPDATMLANVVDQYGVNDGFDIMDFDRPSLRSSAKKGKKGKQLPPELEDALSDEELLEQIGNAWSRDREKKRLKKVEREELRAQGLLGSSAKKTGKADLGQKYAQGMTMSQIVDELRTFLFDDSMESRAFPPMGKRERKSLHEMVSKLGLKSKSVGAGKSRFPVVYKTGATPSTEEYIERGLQRVSRAAASMDRGFLPNMSWKGSGKAAKGRNRPGAGGGFDKAAVGLRHGEIVGAGAAEIGKDSFGHKMMEKMGWSKGMALGKEGEGRLLPVEQVMRSGKAGLG